MTLLDNSLVSLNSEKITLKLLDFRFHKMIDRTNKYPVHAYRLGQEPKDKEYWLQKSFEERLEAVEQIRSQYHTKDELNSGIQRVCRAVKLK
jgi:hypothetical protein